MPLFSRRKPKASEEKKRLAKHNEATAKPEDSMQTRRDSTQDQKGDGLAAARGNVESGRKAEFEETTARGRAAARQKAEHRNRNENEAFRVQAKVADSVKSDESSKGPVSTKQEPNSSVEDSKQTVVEQRFIIVTPRTQAPWASEAYSACKANKKVCCFSSSICMIWD